MANVQETIKKNNLIGKPLSQEDLERIGAWRYVTASKNQLFKFDERKDCILIQGGGFLFRGQTFLLLGVGAIDYLEPLSDFDEIEGIIGTGNALFVSKDFKQAYSALQRDETLKRFEISKTGHAFKYATEGTIAPLIILNRSFNDYLEFEKVKQQKRNEISLDLGHAFFTKPRKCSGSLKSRLANKFVKTATRIHCAGHYTLSEKEMFFDSPEEIKKAFSNFNGYFILGYMKWSPRLLHSMNMEENYRLGPEYNVYPVTACAILKLVKKFCESSDTSSSTEDGENET